MNIERLERLATVLENWREEKPDRIKSFDLAEWVCGTAGCAIGTAMHHPWFQREGLEEGPHQEPVFAECRNWSAVKFFFEIPLNTAEYLFHPNCYVQKGIFAGPHDVARRIRKVLAQEMSTLPDIVKSMGKPAEPVEEPKEETPKEDGLVTA